MPSGVPRAAAILARTASIERDVSLSRWKRPVDAAHLVPRSLGGCDQPDCVVPLCRAHHRRYDRGELDLLPHVEPSRRLELGHTLLHVGLLGLLRRVTGVRWAPVDAYEGRRAA